MVDLTDELQGAECLIEVGRRVQVVETVWFDNGRSGVVETMLSRTGRLAVLRRRSAELKDRMSRSQIDV